MTMSNLDIISDYQLDLVSTILSRKEVISSKGTILKAPPYAPGTFDHLGKPQQEKALYMYQKVFSGSATYLVIEGGTRGGKDVFGINLWAKKLMVSRERMHLALGTSLEHVLNTVYDSNGFGLKYLIPHGEFVRDSEAGAGNRGVFKFLNVYGEEREVHFYGNTKKDDHAKFQGFTFGTVYINEGILQHMNGINEARQRIATSKDSLIIITQNPVGTSHKLYSEFEKGYMMTEEEIRFIEKIQKDKEIRFKWRKYQLEQEKLIKETLIIYKQELLKKLKKTQLKELSEMELQKYERDLYEIQEEMKHGSETIDSNGVKTTVNGIYSKPIEDFIDLPDELNDENSKLKRASMYKIMQYDRGYVEKDKDGNIIKNPNNVVNGFNYIYMHFTMWDNIGMTKARINEETKGYDSNSAVYKQRILGERVSSDGLLLPEFSDDNILTEEIDFYEQNPNSLRMIAIDPGAAHATAIVDAEVDLVSGTVYVLGEAKVDLSEIDFKNRSFLKIEEELIKVIRGRKKRKMPDLLIIDPSNPFLISHFANRGFNVVAADNSTQSAKTKELKFGDKTVKKGTKGIDLIKAGLMRLKFMFHYSCIETITEVRGMSVKYNETTGADDIIKINDDMFDAFKYIANTSGVDPVSWDDEEVLLNYEEEQQFLQDEERQDEKGNLGRRQLIQERIKQRRREKDGQRQRRDETIREFSNRSSRWWDN